MLVKTEEVNPSLLGHLLLEQRQTLSFNTRNKNEDRNIQNLERDLLQSGFNDN